MKLHNSVVSLLIITIWVTPLQAQDPAILTSVSSPLDDHHYLLLDASDWTTAETLANSWGGNLVAVADQAEMDFISDNFSNYGGSARRLWLGLNDIAVEGIFEWSNGEPLIYSNWNAGEPNNSNNEDMGHTLEASPYLWNDINEATNTVATYGLLELEPCGLTAPDTMVATSTGPDITLEFTNNGPYTDTFQIWRDGVFYQDIADPATLDRILAALALPSDDLIARADSDENKRQLREQTERAAQLKIFGAPTFSIEEELFWGNDRLGDAVVWARSGGSL
jgi:hypothetical protein